MRIVICGGHHSSAIPVINYLNREHKDAEVVWFGHKRSQKGNVNETLEYKEITSLKIPFYDIKAGKLYKPSSFVHFLRLPVGFFQSLYYLSKIKPDIILSFGGYLAVPVVLAGFILRIPSVTHEQTVTSGYANRLISKFAKRVFITWDQSKHYFDKEKVIFTGLPIRDSIFKIQSNVFEFKNNLPAIFVMGGKTGSHFVNQLVYKNMEALLSFANIIHQTGDHSDFHDFEKLNDKYSQIIKKVFGSYYARKFIFQNEIGEAFSKADLVISRSGAHTIFELLKLGKKAILIPIMWVSHNEQLKNAELVKESGLAEILTENDFDNELFLNAVKLMINKDIDYKSPIKDNKLAEEIIVNEIIKILKKE